MEIHREHKIRQRAFEMLKPSYICAVKDMERNVCCCHYHVEMIYLKEALNNKCGKASAVHSPMSCVCTCSEVCRPTADASTCQACVHGCLFAFALGGSPLPQT